MKYENPYILYSFQYVYYLFLRRSTHVIQILAYGEKLLVDGMEGWPLAYVITGPLESVHAHSGSAMSTLQRITVGSTFP